MRTKINNQSIIEIGPGKGALTDEILKKKPKSLKIIEKDNFYAKKLLEKYRNNKTIKVYNRDILKFDIEKIMNKNSIIFATCHIIFLLKF